MAASMNGTAHTTTALKRWSIRQDSTLPQKDKVKAIHVYDFDNTLFSSPLPNRQIWNGSTLGLLQGQETLVGGGWWHSPSILAATGQGLDVEESRAWEGCWNEKIVELVDLSAQDDNTLNVLLTGRKEDGFTDLLLRMVASKGLEFDMICLKPSVGPQSQPFGSTMLFKQALLKDIIFTYSDAEEIKVYEDRPKHTKGFRDFFADLNSSLLAASSPESRVPITAEVIQVSEQESHMDPVAEVAEVQRMINMHNEHIRNNTAPIMASPYKVKRTVFYTAYLIAPADTERLNTLVKLPPGCPEHEVRFLANSILIMPRPAPRTVLDKVGGIGAKMSWRVTGVGQSENKVWAARVQPLNSNAQVHTENSPSLICLALRRQAKPVDASRIQNWQPVPPESAFEIETTVGEKVLLRIEEELANEDTYESSFPNPKITRKHAREEDFPPLGAQRAAQHPKNGPRPQQRSYQNDSQRNDENRRPQQNGYANKAGGSGFNNNNRGGRGGSRGQRETFRGRGNNQRGGGRGRGRGNQYRSLDDNVGQGYGSGGMQY